MLPPNMGGGNLVLPLSSASGFGSFSVARFLSSWSPSSDDALLLSLESSELLSSLCTLTGSRTGRLDEAAACLKQILCKINDIFTGTFCSLLVLHLDLFVIWTCFIPIVM